MSDDIRQIEILIGVPREGTPSVFQVHVVTLDSAGELHVGISAKHKKIIIKAMLSFMVQLLE